MPKYSVIIPVYNAECTLQRCVDSLLCQEYMDAEIILVNDGSTDNSGQLCEAYANAYQQVKYLNKQNGGVSSARNAGLEIATGNYILFVDSDDFVVADYFNCLDRLDADEEYDFLWFSYKSVGNGKDYVRKLQVVSGTTPEACVSIFSKALAEKILNAPCNKRYTNHIIRKNVIRFSENLSIGEDTVFNLRYAMQCNNCKISDEVLYIVNIGNQESLSRNIKKDWSDQFKILDEEILKIINTAEIKEAAREQYLKAVNFKKLRSVYSSAKRMHLLGKNIRMRRCSIGQRCDAVKAENLTLPDDIASRLLQIPVCLKMISLIDLMGYILAKKNKAAKWYK